MFRLKYIYLFVVLYFVSSLLIAQNIEDEMRLTPTLFSELVKANHPKSYQAGLVTEQARMQLREARGKFDPQLFSVYDHKMFDEKNYYSVHTSGVKIPTLGGVELKAAFEKNEGIFLNPENNVPEQGLGVIGISIPVLQGLLTDERRTALRQAKSNQVMASAEQMLNLNTLMYDALSTYWKWASAYYQLRAVEDFEEASRLRFEAIKDGFFQGDKAAIDTTESLIQWQEAQMMLQESQAKYQQNYLGLRDYLWNENGIPLTYDIDITPVNFPAYPLAESLSADSLSSWFERQQFMHPKLQKLRAKRDVLEANKRLKAEKLKPKVNVEYNILSQGGELDNFTNGGSNYQQNYKFGVDAKFPIFLREARGGFQQAKIKLQDNEYDIFQTQLELRNKINGYFRVTQLLYSQVTQYRETVTLYERMLEAERIKFDNGESSLFLINSRELKWIKAQQDYLKSKENYFKSLAALYEAMGTLYLQ